MLGVLIVIFGADRIAALICLAGERYIPLIVFSGAVHAITFGMARAVDSPTHGGDGLPLLPSLAYSHDAFAILQLARRPRCCPHSRLAGNERRASEGNDPDL